MGLFISLAVGTGILLMLSRILNAALGIRIGYMAGSFVNHLVGTLFAGALLVCGLRTGTFHGGIPIPYYLGGLYGVIALAAGNYATAQIGNTLVTILLITAQVLSAALIDHFGLFGGQPIPLRASVGLGIGLLIAGAILVQRKPATSLQNHRMGSGPM